MQIQLGNTETWTDSAQIEDATLVRSQVEVRVARRLAAGLVDRTLGRTHIFLSLVVSRASDHI